MLNRIISNSLIKKFLQSFYFFISPAFCALCDVVLSNTKLLCHNCLKILEPVASKTISITKKTNISVFATSLYKPQLKPIIHAKYYKNRALFYELGQFMWDHQEALKHLDFDIIVPIPLHWTRYAWRGFNQAEEIAKGISEKSGKPVIHLLERTRKTKYQNTLNKEERLLNVNQTFKIALNFSDALQYQNAKILLVDDLCTTGATLIEAVKILQVFVKRQNTLLNVIVFCRT